MFCSRHVRHTGECAHLFFVQQSLNSVVSQRSNAFVLLTPVRPVICLAGRKCSVLNPSSQRAKNKMMLTAFRYRERADELRTSADQLKDSHSRKTIIEAAETYERMAAGLFPQLPRD